MSPLNTFFSDRNNHLAGFPLGFSVYISNTTSKNDGVLCFHDSKYTRDNIPETATIPCSYSGQYIIYYNERVRGRNYPSGYYRYARADLCEVEVHGELLGIFIEFLISSVFKYIVQFKQLSKVIMWTSCLIICKLQNICL